MRERLIIATLLAFTLITAACAAGREPEPAGNLLGNPGFEDGADPWFSLKPPNFTVSIKDVAHSGSASALLRMRAQPEDEGTKVFYLVQEVNPGEFLELISGYYRVDHWVRGTKKQYLQFVVIVFGADDLSPPFLNHQIRYLLAGIENEPFAIGNARFVLLGKEDPAPGQWVSFRRNLRQDFQQLWGAVPERFENIRLLFEVRYDDKAAGEGPIEADVYYDDLYMGRAP